MGDHQHSQRVDAPADRLFEYLADVSHLPDYFSAMTRATPAAGDAVDVVAVVDGETTEGQAWFRVDEDARHLAWGSQGPHDYYGELDVTGDDTTSVVTVSLHTERAGGDQVDEGILATLASVKSLVEAGPAPGPATG